VVRLLLAWEGPPPPPAPKRKGKKVPKPLPCPLPKDDGSAFWRGFLDAVSHPEVIKFLLDFPNKPETGNQCIALVSSFLQAARNDFIPPPSFFF